MKQEIERKFLVNSDAWKNDTDGVAYKQGYLISNSLRSVRIRIADKKGYITIKGGPTEGSVARPEYEYEIPLQDAEDIFTHLCEEGKIEKTRYKILYENHIWEVDVFHGANQGLVTVEVELTNEDEEVIVPSWVGEEISHDVRYANGKLAKEPFSGWN